ncbi:MAG TPA: choice-of-anchor tandem repeat GloVer-containing protein [Candidatus Cybelea sp.]|nr:choice-of-anchor tandem repeat GloVer-containing protein [Candidatus Cybelea sp.]
MRFFVAVVCGALLAGCAHGMNSSLLPSGALPAGAGGANAYALLYNFKSGEDAGYPYAGLMPLNGTLYGTTYGGGGGYQWGTVFRVSTTGQEHVLYRFKAGNDGAHPYAGLIELNGTFYGTTYQGGKSGAGTVFSVSPAGAEHVLYSFKGGTDGEYPYGRLLDVNGTLFGTTYTGGVSYGWGVVFKVSTTGEEHVIYRFKAGNDGAHPYAGLIAVNGMLYGTTYQGGRSGAGTVFRISPSGDEKVIYSFKGGSDGQYPYARLLLYKGTLYGTTYSGGVSYGWGVIFKVSTSGTEKVLYRFKANSDGAHPYYAGLIEQNGKLYGTTYQGGAKGAGTVFWESPSGGVDHVVYSFKGGADGQYPYDGLIPLSGTLYGTTEEGGSSSAGTVFKVSL